MRYIITQTQLHTLVYKYLNDIFSNKDFREEINPFFQDGSTYSIDMVSDEGEKLLTYFWYGPGEYDDGTPHNGVGSLHIHHNIVDMFVKMFSIRESKVLDIVADWVSQTLGGDIDEVDIHPKKN